MKNANLIQPTKGILKNARISLKNVEGTPCFVIKKVWEASESEGGEGVRDAIKAARIKNRQKLIDLAKDICEFGDVGGTRKNGTTIRFSADLVLRFLSCLHKSLCNVHNNNVREIEKAERAARKQAEQAEKERKQAEKAKADAEKRHADKEKVRKAREEEEKQQAKSAKKSDKKEA